MAMSSPFSAPVTARPREGEARPGYATRSPPSMKSPTVAARSIFAPAIAAVTSMMEIPFEVRSTKSRSSRNLSWRTRIPSIVGRYSPSTTWMSPASSIDRRYSETPCTVIPTASAIVRCTA